ncbi:MAG: hypothetical protein KG028_07345 [Actinobacteria bacterium]|nr:hypothetical protein [Actinomycetota bacterium]
MLRWPRRRWVVAVAGTAGAGLLMALPTALVPSAWFSRMTPPVWWNWPIWGVSALLVGLLLATYARSPTSDRGAGAGAGGGLLTVLAVGCPVCNKVVVATLGVAGALQWWAPLQPILGILSLGLLGWALRVRLRAERACRVPVPTAAVSLARQKGGVRGQAAIAEQEPAQEGQAGGSSSGA